MPRRKQRQQILVEVHRNDASHSRVSVNPNNINYIQLSDDKVIIRYNGDNGNQHTFTHSSKEHALKYYNYFMDLINGRKQCSTPNTKPSQSKTNSRKNVQNAGATA